MDFFVPFSHGKSAIFSALLLFAFPGAGTALAHFFREERTEAVSMEILGSIQGENVVVEEREKMQGQLRELIARLQRGRHWKAEQIAYKVHFWRPSFATKVDSLIEFRADGQETWFARANGPDPWRSFCKAMGSLKQIVTEMEMREDYTNAASDDEPGQ